MRKLGQQQVWQGKPAKIDENIGLLSATGMMTQICQNCRMYETCVNNGHDESNLMIYTGTAIFPIW